MNDLHWATNADNGPIQTVNDVMVMAEEMAEGDPSITEMDLYSLSNLMNKVLDFVGDENEAARHGMDFIHNGFETPEYGNDDWS